MNKLLPLLLLSFQCIYATNVIVKDLKLFVDCEEYFIKGMAYTPTPLGYQYDGGFCSIKETAWGEEISACYDRDYFDGSMASPNRDPAGPSKGWFIPLWERDFPAMKELGINTLRLYSANPTTKQSSERDVGTSGIVAPYGKDHTQFMAMADSYGFKVIFPLIGDYNVLVNNNDTAIRQYLMNQIDEVGNSSALLMWIIGNELPLQETGLVARLNNLMDFVRNYTYATWERIIPVTIAVADDPSTYDNLMSTLKVDVFSSNAGYRGNTFQDLWSGSSSYPGFAQLTQTYNKPLFVSEIGWSSTTPMDSDWFNQIYSDLINHYDQGSVGGAFFEWSDQTYKSGETPSPVPMGVVYFEAAVDNTSGENSTEANVWLADTLVKKPVFDSIKSGTYQGIAFNFNSNPFTLVGRSAKTLDAQTCNAGMTSTTGSVATTSSTASTSGSTGKVTSTGATTGTVGTTSTVSTTGKTTTSTSSTPGKTTTTTTSKGTTSTSSSSSATASSTTSSENTPGSTTGTETQNNQSSSATAVKVTAIASIFLCITLL